MMPQAKGNSLALCPQHGLKTGKVGQRDEILTAKSICGGPGIGLSTLQELNHLPSQLYLPEE